MNKSVVEKVVLLIETFTSGLASGVKHYNKAGKELMTVKEILETLRDESVIDVKFPEEEKG